MSSLKTLCPEFAHPAHLVRYDLSPTELIEEALQRKEGVLTANGALMVDTGAFTGRSPKDRFLVKDDITEDTVWWGEINIPISTAHFERLYAKMTSFLQNKEVFVRDLHACAAPEYRLNVRVITTLAWHNLFCDNLFIRPDKLELKDIKQEFTILCIPDFAADPETDGVKHTNFTVINFSKRMILIGGTAYAGEMKKGIFSVLNFILPHQKKVLSMHCSANVGKDGDSALFFGLSGTGKTTLSSDPQRYLVGDDEHGWSETGIFNIEGGCYAKVIDLSEEKEPDIFHAIKHGAILENTRFVPGTLDVDYSNKTVTENTRTAYPLTHIPSSLDPSVAQAPKHIFFLTADAFGILPPISKLNENQAMYHFISGYTAKVAGTEMGVVEPKLTFSACFGAAFLPLHPMQYALLFGEKLKASNAQVWLINTGWTGGTYGKGTRISLSYTRAMITAALEGKLDYAPFRTDSVFGMEVPEICPGVPASLLNPKTTWTDPKAYDEQAKSLAASFRKNFQAFEQLATPAVLSGGPLDD
jgi:phosphoenolpyruvate carboxykinase (ATP)